MSKKHIIYLFSDQHNGDVVGYGGDPTVRTPNLNRMALNGTTLANCYCSSPLCVPSRSSMLSGLLPSETGIFNNFQCLRSDRMTFVNSIAAAGYESVLCGRMHFVGPDQRHGFEKRLVGDMTPSYPGLPKNNYGEALKAADFPGPAPIEKAGAGYSAVLQYDTEVTEAAIGFLQDRKEDRPLFMTVGFYGPHCPYVAPKELYDYYFENLPPVESISEEFRANVHPAVKKWYENRRITEVSREQIRKVRAAYYGMVEFLDDLMGKIIEAVDRTLGLENTILVYGSDHGDNIGANGLFWKTNLYDGAARVPLVFSCPGLIPENTTIREPASLMDIGPTFIHFAGGPELPKTHGLNLGPILTGGAKADPERPIIAQLADVKGDNPSAMIRKGDWKLVLHSGYDVPQLFDLDEDPRECDDLGSDPAHEEVRRELLGELAPYWDEERIKRIWSSNRAHEMIFRQWVQATRVEGVDEWYGDVEKNHLIDG